jgi:hypothetical protein
MKGRSQARLFGWRTFELQKALFRQKGSAPPITFWSLKEKGYSRTWDGELEGAVLL